MHKCDSTFSLHTHVSGLSKAQFEPHNAVSNKTGY